MEMTNQTPAPRTPLHMPIAYRKNYARTDSTGFLRNISLSGAFLETDLSHFFLEEKIVLKFNVSGRERKVVALVVWKNDSGCGVKFVPSNNRDIQIVDDFIYFVENQRTDRRSVLDSIFKKVS